MQAHHHPVPLLLAAGGVRDLLLFNLAAETTTILRVSPNSKTLVGTAPADLLGLSLASLIHPDDATVFAAELRDAARSAAGAGRPFRFHARIASVLTRSGYAPFDLHGSMQAAGFLSLAARPLRFEQSARLDALLDLKMEEMRLLRQIQELRDEELAEGDEEVSGSSSAVVVAELSSRSFEGDAGIVFRPRSIDTHQRRRPRVEKRAEYHCCERCGTTTAFEWRKGPGGRKRLCNSCGCKW